jgi:hypothetical protein
LNWAFKIWELLTEIIPYYTGQKKIKTAGRNRKISFTWWNKIEKMASCWVNKNYIKMWRERKEGTKIVIQNKHYFTIGKLFRKHQHESTAVRWAAEKESGNNWGGF